MILRFAGAFGLAVSLDLTESLGKKVELECFQFVVPPVEFRLVRNGLALQEWQEGNTELYDLQHAATTKEWSRGAHRFVNDLIHRDDLQTCGVLSRDLLIETRGLAGDFLLLVWPRMSTCQGRTG
jgi:hypothetical protein